MSIQNPLTTSGRNRVNATEAIGIVDELVLSVKCSSFPDRRDTVCDGGLTDEQASVSPGIAVVFLLAIYREPIGDSSTRQERLTQEYRVSVTSAEVLVSALTVVDMFDAECVRTGTHEARLQFGIAEFAVWK